MGSGGSSSSKDPLRKQKRLISDALNLYTLGPGAVDPTDVFTQQPISSSTGVFSQPISATGTGTTSLPSGYEWLSGLNPQTTSPLNTLAGPTSVQSLGNPSTLSAGNLPGTIFPVFSDLQDLSSQNFLSQLSGDNVNPTIAQALGMITDPTAGVSGFGGAGMFAGSGMGQAQIPNLPTIVDPALAQQAVSDLMNQPSIFDQMSGGPIVDEINTRTNTLIDANTDRAMTNLERALDINNANQGAEGLISSSQNLRQRQAITDDVLNDLNVTNAGLGLESTRYLGDLAMQDLQLGTRRLESVIQAALTEKGIDADLAATIAKINADQMQAMAVARIQSQTQLALGNQSAGLSLLDMINQDFRNTQGQQLQTSLLPFDLTAQVLGANVQPSQRQTQPKAL